MVKTGGKDEVKRTKGKITWEMPCEGTKNEQRVKVRDYRVTKGGKRASNGKNVSRRKKGNEPKDREGEEVWRG